MPYPSAELYPEDGDTGGGEYGPSRVSALVPVPHFALPLRFDRGAAVVVEQDTAEEITACCLAVLLCPLGWRLELPDFGITDPTFTPAPNTREMTGALARWEPRAHNTVTTTVDALDTLVARVQVRTRPYTED